MTAAASPSATAQETPTPKEKMVVTDIKNGIGLITLNRASSGNALTLEMIRSIDLAMEEWAKNPDVKIVLVQSEGDSFCSGADMRVIYDTLDDVDNDLRKDYFREEYILNRHIFHFPKPFVSVINGQMKGDGVGLAVFGSHRIASDKTRLTMSETDIGFIVDGGATYQLSRMPGATGMYIGLTGVELDAADALYTGIATHYIAPDKLKAVEEHLTAGGFSDNAKQELDEILKPYNKNPGTSQLEAQKSYIDQCFDRTSVEEILYQLAEGETDWHKAVLQALILRSPTCLKVAQRLIRAGRRLPFDEALQLEYRVAQHVMQHHDFREGIRAHIIDEDHKTQWLPDIPEAVSTRALDRFFEPLPEGELRLKIDEE